MKKTIKVDKVFDDIAYWLKASIDREFDYKNRMYCYVSALLLLLNFNGIIDDTQYDDMVSLTSELIYN